MKLCPPLNIKLSADDIHSVIRRTEARICFKSRMGEVLLLNVRAVPECSRQISYVYPIR